MKISVITSSFLAILLAASTSFASLQVGSLVTFDTSPPGTFGGRFHLTDGGSPAGKDIAPFETFCVELTEFVSNNTTYVITGIGDVTVQGGRTLTNKAAWLYTEFRNGTLNGFDYDSSITLSSADDANALQWALWQEMGYSNAAQNSILPGSPAAGYEAIYNGKSWEDDYANDASWDKSSDFLGDVRVINLQTQNGEPAQDQLVILPDTAIIPEATTFAVWSILAMAGALSYRKRS